jgi:hypothetical protein
MIDNKQHIADFLTYISHGTYNLQLFFILPIYVSAPVKLAMTDFFFLRNLPILSVPVSLFADNNRY